MIPPRVQDIMVGETIIIEGVLADSPMPILPNIEALIDLHRFVSVNVVSLASKLGGGWYRHLALTITDT